MSDRSSLVPRSLAHALLTVVFLLGGLVPAYAMGFVVLRGGGTPTVWYYDTGLQRWSALPDLPVPVGTGGGVVTANASEVYVLRGGGTREFYRLRLSATPAWQRMADFPEAVGAGSSFAASPWTGVYALAGGGSTTLWRFDTVANSWNVAASLPAAAGAGSALSYSIGGGVEALLGGAGQQFTSDWNVQTWQQTFTYPNAPGTGASLATTYDGCVYALPGGANGSAFFALGASWLQSCTNGNRAAFPVTPTDATSLVGSWDSNAFVYALAGAGSRAVYRYDNADNLWTLAAQTPAPIGSGGGAALYRGGSSFGFPVTYPLPLPAFTGTPVATIQPPSSPQSSQVVQASGLPANMQFCLILGGVNAGCGVTSSTGAFAYNFGSTGVAETFPRHNEIQLDNGALVYDAVQTDGVYPQTIAMSPSGSMVLSAPVVSYSAEIHGDGFPRGCESSVLYSVKSGVVSGLGGFPTWLGSWAYNFNYPAVAETADRFRWLGSTGLCNGYVFEGANPGGAYPRTVTMTDAGHAGVLSVSPASLTFPPTPIGTFSSAQTLIVKNTGTGPLVIRDVALYDGQQSEFSTATVPVFPPPPPGSMLPCFSRALEPNDSCKIDVRFKPAANGLRASAVGIAHTDGDGFTLIPVRGGELPDTTPPVITCSASPSVVWPPNGKMVPASIAVTASDAGSGLDGYSLISATVNDGGDASDIQGFAIGAASTTGSIRATRSGGGTGRTYSFTYRASDHAGNTATCTTTIVVPHDQGK
jgi:N-acetylneuraminic acid mutarotase